MIVLEHINDCAATVSVHFRVVIPAVSSGERRVIGCTACIGESEVMKIIIIAGYSALQDLRLGCHVLTFEL